MMPWAGRMLQQWLRSRLRVSAAVVRAVWLGMAALGAGYLIGLYNQPNPVTTIDVHELDGVAVRGGVLDLLATVDQKRACVTAVRRWLWRPDPANPGFLEWAYLPDVPFKPPADVGIDQYRLRIPVPAWVEDGDWHYLGEPDDDCSPWRRWLRSSRRSPDVVIRITNPTQANPAPIVSPPGAIEVIPSDAKPAGGNP